MSRVARASLLGISLLTAAPAAGEVRFPLTVDHDSLRAAFRKHLSDGGGEAWRSADGCRSLVLRDPEVSAADAGRLRLSGKATVTAGLGLLGLCWGQLTWDGQAEILGQPEIGADWRLRLREPDTRLYDADRQSSQVVPRVWDAVRAWAEAEITTFAYDLGPPVAQVKSLLGAFADPVRSAPLLAALQTIRPVGATVEADGVKVLLAIDLPPAPAAPRAPEPALSPAELKRWQGRLESWDGFLVFVIKNLGVGGGSEADPAVRSELLDLLLTTRRDLLDVLGRGPEPGVDPVRPLFLRTWDRLRGLLRRAVAQRGNETRALRYAAFLTAGDALAALEAAAPAAGLELSADGLRRLARVLDPEYAGDPVEYSELPDHTLRQLFRFRDPDAPPRRPRRPQPSSWWWLAPRAAHADTAPTEWVRLAERLNRWVPERSELISYRDTVARLLTVAAERTIDPDALDERFDRLFYQLVKAVAWQESCWRQFVHKDGAVTYVLSSTGDVGIMQINVRIWRGFFSPERLRWSATYNAGAGAEILFQLLVRYGLREARTPVDSSIARATYSAYNGGPARYRRYRQHRVPADLGFWDKYRAVSTGQADDRVLCVPLPRAA
jgi:hypothetical protein